MSDKCASPDMPGGASATPIGRYGRRPGVAAIGVPHDLPRRPVDRRPPSLADHSRSRWDRRPQCFTGACDDDIATARAIGMRVSPPSAIGSGSGVSCSCIGRPSQASERRTGEDLCGQTDRSFIDVEVRRVMRAAAGTARADRHERRGNPLGDVGEVIADRQNSGIDYVYACAVRRRSQRGGGLWGAAQHWDGGGNVESIGDP
jgi:hypothetical protein